MALRFVTATRSTLAAFKAESPLCRLMRRVSEWSRIELTVIAENRAGLPLVFNEAIDAAAAQDILVFIHDDVWVDDWFIERRLEEALSAFDVIGVAGNTRRMPKQQAWWLAADTKVRDASNIRGAVAHGAAAQGKVTNFGPTPAQVQLLDGVLTAARAGTLQQHGVRFDPAFDFHFYDTDFCRSCTAAGLRMGTWPIAITHASSGNHKTPAWDAAYMRYLKKWPEKRCRLGVCPKPSNCKTRSIRFEPVQQPAAREDADVSRCRKLHFRQCHSRGCSSHLVRNRF